MKIVPFLAVLLCVSVACRASETAYKALRAVGTQRGQDVLNRVIEVQGRAGSPQPDSWKIVLDDQSARGGVREIEVSNGRIVSERTPVNAYTGASVPMNFQKLNLDSGGAFTIAEKEAKKAHLGFDGVNYTLRSGESGKSPVWVLNLVDSSRRTVGTMHVTADTGAVVRSDLFGQQRNVVVHDVAPEEQQPDRTQPESDRDRAPSDDGYAADENGERRLRIGHRIKHALDQAGSTVQHFFTGELNTDR